MCGEHSLYIGLDPTTPDSLEDRAGRNVFGRLSAEYAMWAGQGYVLRYCNRVGRDRLDERVQPVDHFVVINEGIGVISVSMMLDLHQVLNI